MTIKTKYNIGDSIWTTRKGKVYFEVGKCPVCQGKGILGDGMRCDTSIRGGKFVCKNGTLRSYRIEYTPIEEIIDYIEVCCYVDAATEETYSTSSGEYVDIDEIFLTKEEAQAECDRRNAECNSPLQ